MSRKYARHMKSYRLIYSHASLGDLDEMVAYITSIRTLESALRYKDRVICQLESLTYTADALHYSRKHSIRLIHPNAKTRSIMNRKWTAVFHIEGDFVMVDRILVAQMIKD